MPAFVRTALVRQGGSSALYAARPAYQRNDYLMWINKAKREGTRLKRLQQMLGELARGGSLHADGLERREWSPLRTEKPATRASGRRHGQTNQPGGQKGQISRKRPVDPKGRPDIVRPLRRSPVLPWASWAPVAELVDALDSKSSSARSAGSIPARGTILLRPPKPWRRRAEARGIKPLSSFRLHRFLGRLWLLGLWLLGRCGLRLLGRQSLCGIAHGACVAVRGVVGGRPQSPGRRGAIEHRVLCQLLEPGLLCPCRPSSRQAPETRRAAS